MPTTEPLVLTFFLWLRFVTGWHCEKCLEKIESSFSNSYFSTSRCWNCSSKFQATFLQLGRFDKLESDGFNSWFGIMMIPKGQKMISILTYPYIHLFQETHTTIQKTWKRYCEQSACKLCQLFLQQWVSLHIWKLSLIRLIWNPSDQKNAQ